MKSFSLLLLASVLASPVSAQISWPDATTQTRPGTRWWWMGSAVDAANISYNLEQYAKAGIGTVEIAPIYGVQGSTGDIRYLSSQWMSMMRHTQEAAASFDMQVDLTGGTGWPFGGPSVSLDDAASKLITATATVTGDGATQQTAALAPSENTAKLARVVAFPQGTKAGEATDITASMQGTTLQWTAPEGSWLVVAIYNGHTKQAVKRAAPGGEGWVLDHFNRDAVERYLAVMEKAFEQTGTPYPATFFNDSYEVYGADWSPVLLEEFERRRGYKLELQFDKFLGLAKDNTHQVVADYRKTLAEMLHENFTEVWTKWAHSHGAQTRNQAHGSPAPLLDLYATVDIPEIEGFGLSDFGIRGLRTDPGFTRANYSDFATLKWASSAAHVMGKPLTSSETFTWLTEHFRTSLSQMKPDLDLLFCAGVNRMFFHGTTYSPQEVAWPGWKFYAAIDMSPTNSIWRDAPELMQYITRVQSFMQMGQPDNDVLVYAPFEDSMYKTNGVWADRLLTFPIDNIKQKLPSLYSAVANIESAGFDCDYVSDLQLQLLKVENGQIVAPGGTSYASLVIPVSTHLPQATQDAIERLKAEGADIVTGYGASNLNGHMGSKQEEARSRYGLKMIRRKDSDGYHYFVSNLSNEDIARYVQLGVEVEDAVLFNPMTGEIRRADIDEDGKVWISLRSGESMILRCYSFVPAGIGDLVHDAPERVLPAQPVNGPWQLSFTESTPAISQTYDLDSLQTWENLNDETARLMGTGVYTTTFSVSEEQMRLATAGFDIQLGDVRESARLYVNGVYEGTAWAAPFTLRSTNVKAGENTLRIEVTNLPANRVRQMDIDGTPWRLFNDVNILAIKDGQIGVSGVTSYADWQKMPSGLNSRVRVAPVMFEAEDGLVAEFKGMQPLATEESPAHYVPVYQLRIVDGTPIDGDSIVAVSEDKGGYKAVTVKGVDGRSYSVQLPAYGEYTMTQCYDFANQLPDVAFGPMTSRVMNGFEGRVQGAQYIGKANSEELYPGLTFTSGATNLYYFFPGYGMNVNSEVTATLQLQPYDMAVLSSVQGSQSGNSAVWNAADSTVVMQEVADEQTVDFLLKKRSSGVVYRSMAVYSPVSKPDATGISTITVAGRREDMPLYNIYGQRVDASYRGIVIKNGKKVMQ